MLLLGAGNAGILWVFCGFLSEFSAWSHKLKSWCRILCLSATGKAQNLWESGKIHIFNAKQVGSFVVHYRHTGCVENECIIGFME